MAKSMMARPMVAKRGGRLRALDGLRGLLAAYILAGHALPFLQLPPAIGWIGGLLSHGRGAVELFFVLSGMVIMRSIGAGDGTAAGGAGLAEPAAFIAARAGRLLPVYLIALAAAALALSLGDPFAVMPWLPAGSSAREIVEAAWPQPWLGHIAAHLTLTQGILPPALLPYAEFSILGPAWSLSTEWQFYMLVAVMLVLGRVRARAFRSWAPFLQAVALAGVAGVASGGLPPEWQPGRAFLPHEAWYFALGIASHGLLAARGGRAAAVCWALACLAAIALPWQQSGLSTAAVPLIWTACLLCEAPRPPGIARPLAWLLNAAPLQWLGSISYPLYLIHMPIQRAAMLALAPVASESWERFTLFWGPPAIILPLVAAYALHCWVEVPCWRWSRAMARRMAQAPRSTGPFVTPKPIRRGASGSSTSAAGRP